MCSPDPFDVDWIRPHATFLWAQDMGKGIEFCLAMYMARFSLGLDISDEQNIRNIAKEIQLDAEDIVKAGNDKKFHQRFHDCRSILSDRKIFGVPTFFYKDNLYWGNDRLEWLIRAIHESHDMNVPDLYKDPLMWPF